MIKIVIFIKTSPPIDHPQDDRFHHQKVMNGSFEKTPISLWRRNRENHDFDEKPQHPPPPKNAILVRRGATKMAIFGLFWGFKVSLIRGGATFW